jgi:histidyl-tRNA synthetase
MNRSLKSQMKYAGKSSFSHVCVIGEDELQSKMLKFRSLIDKTEDSVKISDIDKICYDAKGEILWPKA